MKRNVLNERICLFIQVVEDGELLVESDPVNYELRQIRFDKFRTQVKRNKTLLGQTILMNQDDKENNVETVITYIFGNLNLFIIFCQ